MFILILIRIYFPVFLTGIVPYDFIGILLSFDCGYSFQNIFPISKYHIIEDEMHIGISFANTAQFFPFRYTLGVPILE